MSKINCLLILVILHCILLKPVFGQTSHQIPFSFTLSDDAATSAGVFTREGTLVRTLWSGVKYQAGTHEGTWDGLDGEGSLVADGNYEVKMVSNNVQYAWEGVIGNSSTSKTGSSTWRGLWNITAMAIVGQYGYAGIGYTEGTCCYIKFNVSTPNTKIDLHKNDGHSVRFIASDGTYVYWAGGGNAATGFITATQVSDDMDVVFAKGSIYDMGHHSYNAIGLHTDKFITGMAVQQVGNYLFSTHETTNEIEIIDKKTGDFINNITVSSPREIALQDDRTLWVIHDINTVEKYTINTDGTLSSTGLTITSVQHPIHLAISPDGGTVSIIDGTSLDQQPDSKDNHQVKAFATSNGSADWTLGQAGGYATSPVVANDKFFFSNTHYFAADYGTSRPYLCYQPDGSLWVGDQGNYRSLHFSPTRAYIDQIACVGRSYSVVADLNNPTRVFTNYLEYLVDYSKPLAPDNGSWKLIRNWSFSRQTDFDAQQGRLSCVATLSNGRTYALAQKNTGNGALQVVELPPSGNLRFTGVYTPGSNYKLFADGSLWSIGSNAIGQPAVWKKQILTSFDSNYNPQWGAETLVCTTPPVTVTDPVTADGYLKPNQITTSDIIVAFSADRSPRWDNRGGGWHLGGIKAGTNQWLWKAAPSTNRNYQGIFPPDGTYDIGNGVEYAGNFAQALERSIFWGYNGEFWRGSQTNKWNHFWDNGLFIGQFGVTGPEAYATEGQAPSGMAGNAYSGTFVKVGNDYYLYHCDEGIHGGIHRWKISGLNTIQEQTVATLNLATDHGVLVQYFTGINLNNVNLVNSVLAETVQSSDQTNSARWTGFVEPLYSQTYTFYAAVDKRVKLWINDSLIVNQWTNNSQAEFSSPSIDLVVGKKYAIRMEISGGNASLAWSSNSQAKQLIPKSNLYAPIVPNVASGIDLTEGLLFNHTVENGLYGWSREPLTDYGLSAQYGNKFWVFTNLRGMSKTAPDVNILFQPPANGLTATASRNLSTGTIDAAQWSITGKLTYPSNDYDDYNKGQDQGYLQILDENNKIIARIQRRQVAWPSDYRFYLNSAQVAQISWEEMQAICLKPQPITLTVDSAGVTLQYGDFPAVTTIPFDPTSNWQRPKTLQVFFYSPTQNAHELNMAELRFIASVGTTPNAPTVEVDDTKNTISASHRLGTANILVSENNGAFRSYTGKISVGNTPRAAGYWKFKIKASDNRSESPIVVSPKFTALIGLPLPVGLIAFKAKLAASQVNISWSTAAESDVKSFVVERSADGSEFKPVGRVQAQNTSSSYDLIDKTPLANISYYRLKIISVNASFTYSSVVAITEKDVRLSFYPNPVQNILQVQYPVSATSYLEIVSVTGKKWRHLMLEPGSTNISLDIRALPEGLYFMLYRTGTFNISKSFVKQ
jgi:hypothetical protein